MPRTRTVIVDTASPDRTYMPEARALGAEIVTLDENIWDTGVWWYAHKTFKNEPFFYFLHDSTRVRADLTRYADRPLTITGYQEKYDGCVERHKRRIPEIVREVYGRDVPDPFYSCACSLFFCQREVLDKLAAAGLDRIAVRDRTDAEAMERVWGIAFEFAGYDVRSCAWGRKDGPGGPQPTPIQKFRAQRFPEGEPEEAP
jgi:hypothetical protein